MMKRYSWVCALLIFGCYGPYGYYGMNPSASEYATSQRGERSIAAPNDSATYAYVVMDDEGGVYRLFNAPLYYKGNRYGGGAMEKYRTYFTLDEIISGDLNFRDGRVDNLNKSIGNLEIQVSGRDSAEVRNVLERAAGKSGYQAVDSRTLSDNFRMGKLKRNQEFDEGPPLKLAIRDATMEVTIHDVKAVKHANQEVLYMASLSAKISTIDSATLWAKDYTIMEASLTNRADIEGQVLGHLVEVFAQYFPRCESENSSGSMLAPIQYR